MTYNVFPCLYCYECKMAFDRPKVTNDYDVRVDFFCANPECSSADPLSPAGMIFGERLPSMVS